jgi:hypothetical protein
VNKLLIALTVLLLLSGCGLFGGGLPGRAADYYAYMLGHGKDVKYSSFLSPAYRNSFNEDGLANLNNMMRRGNIEGGRIPPVKAKHIEVFHEGNFYMTLIKPEAGEGYTGVSRARWVKVGPNWFLYSGSEAEIEAYGQFPDSLVAQAQNAESAGTPQGLFQGGT